MPRLDGEGLVIEEDSEDTEDSKETKENEGYQDTELSEEAY